MKRQECVSPRCWLVIESALPSRLPLWLYGVAVIRTFSLSSCYQENMKNWVFACVALGLRYFHLSCLGDLFLPLASSFPAVATDNDDDYDSILNVSFRYASTNDPVLLNKSSLSNKQSPPSSSWKVISDTSTCRRGCTHRSSSFWWLYTVTLIRASLNSFSTVISVL